MNEPSSQRTPNLIPLAEADWPALHQLMCTRRFPHVPASYLKARPQFRSATLLGLKQRQQLVAAFVFGPPENGVAFFDAICRQGMAGRWATRPLLRRLFGVAFQPAPVGLGLRAVWVQPHGPTALKACLQAGFQAVTPLRGSREAPVLVLTPHTVSSIMQGKF